MGRSISICCLIKRALVEGSIRDGGRVRQAVNMLDAFSPLLRFLARHVMRIRPGYFRLLSNLGIEVTQDGSKAVETGTTLHEVVIFKKIEAQ